MTVTNSLSHVPAPGPHVYLRENMVRDGKQVSQLSIDDLQPHGHDQGRVRP